MPNNCSILIVCYDFLPYFHSMGGVIRCLTQAEFFRGKGWDVHLLASDGIDYGFMGYEDSLRLLDVHYVADPVRRFFQSRIRGSSTATGKGGGWMSFCARLYRNLLRELMWPDFGSYAIPRYRRAVQNLIEKHDLRHVLISSPPHSVQLLGPWLKRRYGDRIHLTVDFRDSWNIRPTYRKRFFPGRGICLRQERRALEACDLFLYVSEPIRSKTERLHGISLEKKALLVMNGYAGQPAEPMPLDHQGGKKIKIGHFGPFSDTDISFRNPRSLFRVFREHPGDFSDLEVHLFGDITLVQHRPEEYPMLVVHKRLPHREAVRAMSDMDWLLILHSEREGADEVITGKFFEYVAAGRPILCLGPEGMEAMRLIDALGIGLHAEIEDPSAVHEVFRALPHYRAEGYESLDIRSFNREVQYEKLLLALLEYSGS